MEKIHSASTDEAENYALLVTLVCLSMHMCPVPSIRLCEVEGVGYPRYPLIGYWTPEVPLIRSRELSACHDASEVIRCGILIEKMPILLCFKTSFQIRTTGSLSHSEMLIREKPKNEPRRSFSCFA